jgi:hypothetical protein
MIKICKIVTAAMFICGFMGSSATAMAASYGQLSAYGVDTIAGYSALLSSSKTYPNTDIYFTVTKPEGAKISIPAKTNESGIAKVDLYDYHTRKAGKYMVSARLSSDVSEGMSSSFNVYADQVSLDQSAVYANKSVAKSDGSDGVYVSVIIKDQYGNPLQGHLTNLISSRSADNIRVSSTNKATDENGSVTYLVTSAVSGVSIFSAVDSTSGTVFSARSQVAFLADGKVMLDAGGDMGGFIPKVAAADAGPLHQFEILDIPATVQPNQNVSFRVTAEDADKLTIENYTGTIHFSIEAGGGDNVSLPEDYTFKADDLGTHSFGLGLSFTKAGSYNIAVTDVNNTVIKGTKTVLVGGGGSSATQQASGFAPSLVIPTPGSYSLNTQTISGSAGAGSTIKIYDNEQEIGTVQAGSDGKFTFQTNPLADGVHKLYVVSMDSAQNVKGTSSTIEITVDTTPPVVDEIQLDPSADIKPGTVINVKLFSEDNLSSAAVVFNTDITTLNSVPGQPGVYSAQITAPAAAGAYPLDVVLSDQLNNEASYKAKATINVSAEGGTVETPATQESQEPATQETQAVSANLPPSQVFGLIAYGSDKRVTLVWEAATDDKSVNHYRIRYGMDPANTDKVIDTKSAATTWYIPNLENGKEYYFSVSAVDDEGLESVAKSEITSAIPFASELATSVTGRPSGSLAGAQGLHGASLEGYVPPEVSKSGPEAIWLFYGTGLMSGLVQILRRKTKKK